MTVIPFALNESEFNLFIVLDNENLRRMKLYDPSQYDPSKLPPEWSRKKLHTIIVGYATPEDIRQVFSLAHAGAIGEALKLLSRGRHFRPDLGDHEKVEGLAPRRGSASIQNIQSDHDGPPLSLRSDKGESKQ